MTLGELYDVIRPMRAAYVAVAAIVSILVGLIWGSFATVVIHRLPREESVRKPGARCPHCGAKIRGVDLIPVVSFLVLRGKTRCCGKKIPARDLAVELVCAALSLAILVTLHRTMPESATVARFFAAYGAALILAICLVCVAFIDVEYMLIPDKLTMPCMVLGIFTATIRGQSIVQMTLGLLVGFVIVWLPFVVVHAWFRGRPGMGLGDAKLVAVAGAWFGWQGAVFALLAGAIHGVAYAAIARLFGIDLALPRAVREELDELRRAAESGDEEAERELEDEPLADPLGDTKARVPFGPFLVLATLEMLLAHDWLRTNAACWLFER